MRSLPHGGWLAASGSLLLHILILLVWPAPPQHARHRVTADHAPRLVVRLIAAAPLAMRVVPARQDAASKPSPSRQTARKPAPDARLTAVPTHELPDAGLLAGEAPVLDGESLRAQARQLSRRVPDEAIPPLPPGLRTEPRPAETALARAIDKTARPDCRNAHAGAGLLAVFPLLYDTVRDKGCKW